MLSTRLSNNLKKKKNLGIRLLLFGYETLLGLLRFNLEDKHCIKQHLSILSSCGVQVAFGGGSDVCSSQASDEECNKRFGSRHCMITLGLSKAQGQHLRSTSSTEICEECKSAKEQTELS